VDTWSLLADLGRLLFACWLLAVFVRFFATAVLRGWNLRIWPVALAIAVGWVAVLGRDTVVAYALVVVVVRFGLTRDPVPRWRPSRTAAAGIGLAVALLAVATLSYQPLHPLATVSEGALLDNYRTASMAPPAESERSPGFDFTLENQGIATATLRSVTVTPGFVNPRLHAPPRAIFATSGAVVIEGSSGGTGNSHPIVGTALKPGTQLLVSVELNAHACTTGQVGFPVKAVTVHFETLGIDRAQRFDAHLSDDLWCPHT